MLFLNRNEAEKDTRQVNGWKKPDSSSDLLRISRWEWTGKYYIIQIECDFTSGKREKFPEAHCKHFNWCHSLSQPGTSANLLNKGLLFILGTEGKLIFRHIII